MRCAITLSLLGAALFCALDSTGHAQAPTPSRTPRTVSNFVTVTDQTIRAPKPEDWLIHRGNYQAWGYSPLDQINKTNVKNLQLVWARAMEPGINQATPLIYNGVMYLGNPGDVIQAIDAAHIIGDAEAQGAPHICNGIALASCITPRSTPTSWAFGLTM